jgi:thioredoxin-dependent peroxiredoxin
VIKRVLASLVLLVGLGSSVRAADLAVGSLAPAFSLPGSDGKTYTLAQFAGKEGVVLAWFPKAFTPG